MFDDITNGIFTVDRFKASGRFFEFFDAGNV